MHFYYVTDKKLVNHYVHPECNFEIPKLANQKYTSLVRSIHEGCQLNYKKIEKELNSKGYAKLYSYKLNLNTKLLDQLYTPERIAYEKINNYSFLINECRITSPTKVFFNGEVIVLKPHLDTLKYMLKYNSNEGVINLAPGFLDHYLIRNTFSNDSSPFATRKLYPQHTTECRFLSSEYEDLCLKYALSTEDLVPLTMQKGLDIGDKIFNPCITFASTPNGETLKNEIFKEFCLLAPKFNLLESSINLNWSTATFFKKDFDYLGKVSRNSSYKSLVSNIYYKDPEIIHCPKLLDNIIEAFTIASLKVL